MQILSVPTKHGTYVLRVWVINPAYLWMTCHVTTWFRIPDFILYVVLFFHFINKNEIKRHANTFRTDETLG